MSEFSQETTRRILIALENPQFRSWLEDRFRQEDIKDKFLQENPQTPEFSKETNPKFLLALKNLLLKARLEDKALDAGLKLDGGQLFVASNWVGHSDLSINFKPFFNIPLIDRKKQLLGKGLIIRYGCELCLSHGEYFYSSTIECPESFKYHVEERSEGSVLVNSNTDEQEEVYFHYSKLLFPQLKLEDDITVSMRLKKELPIQLFLEDPFNQNHVDRWQQKEVHGKDWISYPTTSTDPLRRNVKKLLEYLRAMILLNNRNPKKRPAELKTFVTRPLHDILYWKLCRILKPNLSDLRKQGKGLIIKDYKDRQKIIESVVSVVLKIINGMGICENAFTKMEEDFSLLTVKQKKKENKDLFARLVKEDFVTKMRRILGDLLVVENWVLDEHERKSEFGKRLASNEPIHQLYTICDDGGYGVHAEARLLLRRRQIGSAIVGEELIGISKFCCAQCTILLRSVPYRVLSREDPKFFTIAGSHGVAYANWQIHSELKGRFLRLFLGTDLYRVYIEVVKKDRLISSYCGLEQLARFTISNIGLIIEDEELRRYLNLEKLECAEKKGF
ncbi:hypothetical protein BKA69DRAFT_1039401 [Paraphysoderma sedebokerense]|nr:hypothetical protein BKA69DRAFT_1039401 [Paraphysoderma sedebokerense]